MPEPASPARDRAEPGPAVLRVRLGARLRRLRESRGITAQQAARAIRGSDSKISRIELGRHAAREIDVFDLLDFYGLTDPAEREELLLLASQALAPPWWHRNADLLPAWYQAFLGLEEGALSVRSYDTHYVPGLLQTAEYARGLARIGGFSPDEAARLLGVHAERVDRFAAGGWRLCAVIDEAVLHRPVGGPEQHAAQLRHLREAARWPGVRVQIRPLEAGVPVAPAGFTILRFDDADLADVVYCEQLTSATCLDRPADVARYEKAMQVLLDSSQPADHTAAIIGDVLARFGDRTSERPGKPGDQSH